MNFVERRTPAGVLTDIRVQHISIDNLLALLTRLPNLTVVSVAKSWPAPNNEAARIQIGRFEFLIETSFADMFISPTVTGIPTEVFEALADHLREAKEKYLDSVP